MDGDQHIARITEQAEYLRDMQKMVDSARMGLYRRVKDAHESKVSPTLISRAAGWKTKKAVYDAIGRWKASNEVTA